MLAYIDVVQDHLLTHIDKVKGYTAQKLSATGDIAVKLDLSGQLVDLWMKPATLDRRIAADIAKEITALITAARQEAAAAAAEIFGQADDLPALDGKEQP